MSCCGTETPRTHYRIPHNLYHLTDSRAWHNNSPPTPPHHHTPPTDMLGMQPMAMDTTMTMGGNMIPMALPTRTQGPPLTISQTEAHRTHPERIRRMAMAVETRPRTVPPMVMAVPIRYRIQCLCPMLPPLVWTKRSILGAAGEVRDLWTMARLMDECQSTDWGRVEANPLKHRNDIHMYKTKGGQVVATTRRPHSYSLRTSTRISSRNSQVLAVRL